MGLLQELGNLVGMLFNKAIDIGGYRREMRSYDDKTLMRYLKSKVMEERVAAACILEERGYDVDAMRRR